MFSDSTKSDVQQQQMFKIMETRQNDRIYNEPLGLSGNQYLVQRNFGTMRKILFRSGKSLRIKKRWEKN